MAETNKEIREKTSIKIKPDIWRDSKIGAIKQGITVSEFVEDALQCQLKKIEGLDALKKKTMVK